MAKFIIATSANATFQVKFLSNSGDAILTSDGYCTKSHCMSGIAAIRANCKDQARYERKTSPGGKLYFDLTSSNGQVIASSRMYDSVQARGRDITYVTTNAREATVEEA